MQSSVAAAGGTPTVDDFADAVGLAHGSEGSNLLAVAFEIALQFAKAVTAKKISVIRRKGRVYVINKANPRFKARQG